MTAQSCEGGRAPEISNRWDGGREGPRHREDAAPTVPASPCLSFLPGNTYPPPLRGSVTYIPHPLGPGMWKARTEARTCTGAGPAHTRHLAELLGCGDGHWWASRVWAEISDPLELPAWGRRGGRWTSKICPQRRSKDVSQPLRPRPQDPDECPCGSWGRLPRRAVGLSAATEGGRHLRSTDHMPTAVLERVDGSGMELPSGAGILSAPGTHHSCQQLNT